jgi:exodeoxyribonuclease-3
MKLASWNVNSIKARLPIVTDWVRAHAPEVLFLQELKGEEFPALPFQDLGYHSLFVSQKAYNGVAILSKTPAAPILTRLPDDETDEQARYLEAELNHLRLINIYLPNGNPLGTDKFVYKLAWMDRLRNRLSELRKSGIPFLVGGDFNVIPEKRDCYDPDLWAGDALFHKDSVAKFRALLNLGLVDAFRIGNQESHRYTFWDYQGGAWPKNHGLRIDHFLLSPPLVSRFVSCTIDSTPRELDKSSDHTPIILELSEVEG